MNTPDHEVLVLLNETEGHRSLPIVIGPHEAVAIAIVQAGLTAPRPGAHDLLVACLTAAGAVIKHVVISALIDGSFLAEVVLGSGARVDARASDAIAVALRAEVQIWCEDDVLEAAAIVLDVDEDDREHVHLDGALAEGEADERVAEFREFLESIDPEDFSDSDGVER